MLDSTKQKLFLFIIYIQGLYNCEIIVNSRCSIRGALDDDTRNSYEKSDGNEGMFNPAEKVHS